VERLKLVFGIHNHQPIGNFEDVLQRAVETCYLRQLDVFAEHPNLRFSLHTSGPLLEWMERHYPEYDKKVRLMAERGQVEPMGGGFYEPILPAIPREDALAQIKLMRAELMRRYGVSAEGLWLAERVWEPALPELLKEAGVTYTAVDDTHFRYAGLTQTPMTGYYLTEHASKSVAVFPISKELRYYIPFREPEFIMNFLRDVHQQHPGSIITYADDGEKFGIWPGTYDWVYNKGWLRRFLDAMDRNSDWLEMVPFRDAMSRPPTGRIYLPTASYDEMMEWSLPSEAILRYLAVRGEVEREGRLEQYRPFLRGGLWNNFFVKYPESNLMNKRNLFISRKVRQVYPDPDDPLKMSEARRNVLRSQCNCAYWHGLFGGIYFNNLRDAIWSAMIRADAALPRSKTPKINMFDLVCDGYDEVIVEDEVATWGFHRRGGTVMLIENLPKSHAFHNTLRRREEAYHHIPQGPAGTTQNNEDRHDGPATIHELSHAGLAETPVYDRGPRISFQDHFFGPEENISRFMGSIWKEEGDFLAGVYSVRQTSPIEIEMSREGKIAGMNARVTKTYSFGEKGRLAARIQIEAEAPLYPLRYGSGFNFTLLAPDAPDRYYLFPGKGAFDNKMNSTGEIENVYRFAIRDDWRGVGLEWEIDPPAEVWRAPVYTLSRSEQRLEKTYQGSWALLSWPMLKGRKALVVDITLTML